MRKSLQPLSSLRSFEAVARQLSFSRAADELNVTPGAVSQQIRTFEERLGVRLFDRIKRSVSLIQAGLDLLSRACSNQALPVGERTLTISVAPSFAFKWLLPRLPSFHDQHPDIELRISATVELADFRRDGIDLAIRLGHGRYAGLQAEPLFSEALTPLCSPKILKGKGRLKTPEDLRKHRIIHDTSIPGQGEHSAWDKWLALAGAKHFSARRGVRFTLAELAMQAAIDGAGIVLGRLVLAEGDIAAGRLVRPFKIALPLDVSYFLVRSEDAAPRPELLHFRSWLVSSLKKSSLNGASRRA